MSSDHAKCSRCDQPTTNGETVWGDHATEARCIEALGTRVDELTFEKSELEDDLQLARAEMALLTPKVPSANQS